MTLEGAMALTERFSSRDVDKLAEAALVLRAEVIHLERLLRGAGHAFEHGKKPSREVMAWWTENL